MLSLAVEGSNPLVPNAGEFMILGIAILALMLFIAALIDILHSQHLFSSTKVPWVLATLILPFLGPVAWFFFGRRSAPADNGPHVNPRA